MSGLVKQKEYRLEDSNVENIGGEKDKEVRKDAAMTEEAWKGAGEKPGVQVWRINNFKVDTVHKDMYGQFYEGDSYIILHTIQKEEDGPLSFDLFFWIGKNWTMDEYGTAAYKTVELDSYLNDVPIQYREIQGNESQRFCKVFEKLNKGKKGGTSLEYLKGRNDSGFRHVGDDVHETQLFKYKPLKNTPHTFMRIEMNLTCKKIKADYVYVLLTNDCIYKYNGSRSNFAMRWACQNWLDGPIKGRRPQTKVVIIDDDDEAVECFNLLLSDTSEEKEKEEAGEEGGGETKQSEKEKGEEEEKTEEECHVIRLLRRKPTSDDWELMAEGDDIPNINKLDDDYLYLLDLEGCVQLLDKRLKYNKKDSGMVLAQHHLNTKQTKKQKRAPICIEKDDQQFISHMAHTH